MGWRCGTGRSRGGRNSGEWRLASYRFTNAVSLVRVRPSGSLPVSRAFPHRSARAALAEHEADADKLAALEREKSDLLDKVQKMKEVRCSLISRSFCALRRGVPLY